MRRGFPHTLSQELVVFLGLIDVILTSDDLPRKTLEVIRTFTVRGILHDLVCSELLQCEVGEAVDVIKDPKSYQGLHRIWV